jgi:sugar-specific transcriptional regulator TrmB
MVVNELVPYLMQAGLSEYEAKAYAALLEKNPASAYETARSSGIPTSKVYEVVSKLTEKGIISALGGEGTKKYIPIEPGEFVEGLRVRNDATLTALEEGLASLEKGSDVSYIWNIEDPDYLMDRALKMIRESGDSLLLSLWREEMQALEGDLGEARQRGVKVAAVHFGMMGARVEGFFQHPIQDTIYAEKGGRGLVVVADSREALVGTISGDGRALGAVSGNSGFVTLAEDYIKHDIYIMKVVKRFDRELRARFGEEYELLRDVFTDEERI